jgi:uridine kinase
MDRHMVHARGPQITLSSGETTSNNNHPGSTDNEAILAELDSLETPVVIIEGLMALHLPELQHKLDLKLFVETRPEIRTVRRIVRSKERSPDSTVASIGTYYLECAVPGHEQFVAPSKSRADFVVSGDGSNERPTQFLARLIAAELQNR